MCSMLNDLGLVYWSESGDALLLVEMHCARRDTHCSARGVGLLEFPLLNCRYITGLVPSQVITVQHHVRWPFGIAI